MSPLYFPLYFPKDWGSKVMGDVTFYLIGDGMFSAFESFCPCCLFLFRHTAYANRLFFSIAYLVAVRFTY